MKYYNLAVLLLIALKCGADEEPTFVNYFKAVENVTNSGVFNATAEEAPEKSVDTWKLPNINNPSVPAGVKNTYVNATNANTATPLKNHDLNKLPILKILARQMMTKIIGSLMKGLALLNETSSKEGIEIDYEELLTSLNCSSVTNFTQTADVLNASATEAPCPNINNSSEPPETENTFINATRGNAGGPFKKREFGKLSFPKRLRQGTRKVVKIFGSLGKGLAKLNETDSEEDSEADYEEPSTVNCSTVQNVTNCEVNATATEAPAKLSDQLIQLPNINNSSKYQSSEDTAINATKDYAVNPLIKKMFDKLSLQSAA